MIRFMYDCEKCERKDTCKDQKLVKKTEKYLTDKKQRLVDSVQHPEIMTVDLVCHCEKYQTPRHYRTVK